MGIDNDSALGRLSKHLGQTYHRHRARPDEVRKHLPGSDPKNPLRIKWSLVCLGYQPELARGWGACTRAFAEESKQDRVFEESLFWVVTRTLNCFY